MKIMHVQEWYGPGGGGGTEQSVPNLCSLLEERGHQTVVLYGTDTGELPRVPGRNVYQIPRLCFHTFLPNPGKIRRALEIVRKEDPDVLHLHLIDDVFLAKQLIRRKPCVLFIHNHNVTCVSGTRFLRRMGRICPRRGGLPCLYYAFAAGCNTRRPWPLLYSFFRYYYVRSIAKKVKIIGVDSEYMKESLLRSGLGAESIYVTPTVTELPEAIDADYYPRENRILFVGRITAEKGLEFLLRSLQFVKSSYALVVVGDGYALPHARKLADHWGLGGQVRFEGHVSKKDLDGYYREASVVVVPSVYPEPLGLVGPEAMAHARPVVAFKTGGIPEWLSDGETGFLVDRADTRSMGERIDLLLRDKALAIEMGRKGREHIEKRLSPAAHVDQMLKIYEHAIAAQGDHIYHPGELFNETATQRDTH